MKLQLKKLVDWGLRGSGLQYWPVRVKSGVGAGARWTLYPWTSYWRGTQEPMLHDALLALGDVTGWSCWDLGAHFGIYSVGLARRVGPTGQVASFEPNPLSFARLRRHRAMNKLEWLQLFNAAVSEKTAQAELYTYGNLGTTFTHLPYDGEVRKPEVMPLAIKTVSLDDLVGEGRIRLPQFIKVDVEGHGHRALTGAMRSIRESRPLLLMEFHYPPEVEGTRALLDPLGYHWEPVTELRSADGVGTTFFLRPD